MSRRAALLHPAPSAGFARADAVAHYAPDSGLEPRHLQLAATVDVFARRLDGVVTHHLVCRTAGWRSLRLDAVDLDITDVTGSHSLKWRYDGDALHILFDDGVEVGGQRQVTVKWSVQSPLTGLFFGGSEATLGQEPAFAATDHETERARYWLPCVDHPSVRTTLDICLRTDARFLALANGADQGVEDHGDGSHSYRWALDRPCPSYLISFVLGDLARFDEEPIDGLPVAAFAPRPYTADNLRQSFGQTRDLITWITGRLQHPLPWPKYFQFAAPGIGGAMENISLVSWDDAFVADDRLRAEIGELIDIVNLHELAHTWFGDLVVCRDFAHSWLKESWATYMEVVWLQETATAAAADAWLLGDLLNYCDEADNRYARPIVTRHFDSAWDLFDRHLYPGGAWRLHMLRHKLGDDAFWAGTRAYLQRHAGEVVETDDLRRELEAASGRSLARFFEQWLHSPGYPKLKATWDFDADRKQGSLKFEQTQVDADRGIGLFDLDIEVAVETADGQWLHRSLRMEGATGAVVLPLDASPLQVVIDPHNKLLAGLDFDPGLDRLGRSLEDGSSPRACLHAVRTLCQKGRANGISKVEAAYRDTAEYRQRAHYARFLGESGSAAALSSLIALLDWEQDPRAMGPLTAALGNYRDPAAAAALQSWLALPDRPYRAAAGALTSLGKQRDPAQVPFLIEEAEQAGWWGWVQRGAIVGLGETGDATAWAWLDAALAQGRLRDSVLPSAAEALATCARRLDQATRAATLERLTALARQPNHALRLAIGRALQVLGEPAGLGLLDSLRHQVSQQHAPAVDRNAAALRKASATSPRARLEGEVERLQDQLRKLQQRLDKVEAAAPAPAPKAKAKAKGRKKKG